VGSAIHFRTALGDNLLCNSLRRTDNHRIGFNTRMLVTIHLISGFQQMESKMFRQADGVGAE
jgi:hypothetical protein